MFEQVKQEIDDKIKTNGNNEITATRLNGVLQDMMDATAEELSGYVQKTDPPSPATGDIVVFDEFGGLGTSEKTVNDFATASQGAKADTALQPTGVKTINNQSIVGSGNITIEGGGTDDYADLDNKPQINSVTLSGNKSVSDLGLATAAQGAKADTAVQPSALNDYVQKSQTTGLLKNNGTVDTQTAGRAESALQPLSGAQENNFASFDANGGIQDSGFSDGSFIKGVKQNGTPIQPVDGVVDVTVQDGASAYDLYVDSLPAGTTPLSPEAWLASLKANIGAFKFVSYDQSAESAFTTGGIGTTYSSTIDGLTAGTDTTSDIILLMNNTDGTTQPTKTFMIATQEVTPATTPATYEFIYAGDLQSAMPSNVLTKSNVVNDLTTGGTQVPLSAEQGKVIGEELYGEEGYADVELTLNSMYYYEYNSSENKIKVNSSALSSANCVRIQVQAGDKFKIYGADTASQQSVTRLWCFSDGTVVNVGGVDYYTVLSVANDMIDTRTNGAEIVAPAGSVYLTICFIGYDSSTDGLQKWQKVSGGLVGDVSNLKHIEDEQANISEELYGEEGYGNVNLDLHQDSYISIKTDVSKINTTPSVWLNSGMYCAQIQVQAGDKFKIYGLGNTGSTLLYGFADSTDNLLSYSGASVDYRTNGHEFIAPPNAARLVVNFKEYNSATDKLQKWGIVEQGLVEQVENLDSRVTALEEVQEVKSVLQGKNVLVFGDSLTEFVQYGTTNGTWCKYAEDISGATFINIGIGGTQLKSRIPMAHIFDAGETYAVNDYVYNLTSEHYHLYKCTTPHTGSWDANNFTEITNSFMYVGLDVVNLVTMACDTNTSIESRFADAYAAADCVKTNVASHDNNIPQVDRLKAVDFSTVDAIVIMGGTNDFGGDLGDIDSDVITEERGAINIIVEQLSTAYGTIPIYFIKEPVKWFPLEGTYPDNYWCDVYTRSVSGVNITLAEYFDKIEEQFSIVNHIPVCDLYYGLGWNKFNFWNYFRIEADGTHPYYGFKQIAEKIVSFIIANKVF